MQEGKLVFKQTHKAFGGVNVLDANKQEYNQLLARWKTAEGLTLEIKHIPELRKIINRLSVLLMNIGTYTDEEALNGFK